MQKSIENKKAVHAELREENNVPASKEAWVPPTLNKVDVCLTENGSTGQADGTGDYYS